MPLMRSLHATGSWDSSVNIVTGLWAGRPKNRIWNSGEVKKLFSFPQHPDRLCGPIGPQA
jgi:hypothetical protein